MGLNNVGLGFVFTARDLASGKMQRLEQRFSSLDERVTGGTARMTRAFRQLGVGLAVLTAGAAAVAGSLSLANAAGQFEQGLAAVRAVTRASARDMDMLRQAAVQAGIETQFSPDEAVAGLQSLATAGQTATQATRTLLPVLDLAAGSLGQLGVAQSAEAVVGTLNAYGFAAEQAAGVTDKLLRITQLTNFQTRDFEAGLAKAAATGAVFHQRLDDVLIAMGLLRNRNIDASSAATALRESMRRVAAESRAQQAILGAGVDIFDRSSGRMRSLVDIMVDFARATERMSEKERNRRVVTAFGARGLLAFNAVLEASFTTMREGAQVTLRGAEAIDALRREMDGAKGTAAGFRAQLLDTFAGQKTLLQGTLQTFAVALGEPFAAVFKPIVRTLVDALNALLRAFQAIPAPIKKVFAGVVVAAGGLLMLAGGAVAAKASIALMAIALKVLGVGIGGLLATLLPAILVISVLGAVVAGFAVAFHKNLGGIGDVARRVWESVALLFRGLEQLFAQGGFSGAVREELGRAENQGLKRFLIAVWQIVYRVQRVWEGFKAGFVGTVEAARPVFQDLADALSVLGHEIAALFTDITGQVAGLPSAEFRDFGAAAGAAIASVIQWYTRLLAMAARIAGGVVAGFRSMMSFIRPAFAVVREALGELRTAWDALTGRVQGALATTGEATDAWRAFGKLVGQVLGSIATVGALALGGLIKVLAEVIGVVQVMQEAFVTAGAWIGETAARLYLWFSESLPAAISSAVRAVSGLLGAMVRLFAGVRRWFRDLLDSIGASVMGVLQPAVEVFRGVGRAIKRVFDDIRDHVIGLLRRVPDELLPSSLEPLKRQPLSTELRTEDGFEAGGRTEITAARAQAAGSSMPAAAEAQGRRQDMAQLDAHLSALSSAQAQGDAPPFTVNVQVDGETIARATHKASSDLAARSFSPVPVY